MDLPCSLCSNETNPFSQEKDRHYFQCSTCKAIQLDPNNYLSAAEEKTRYEHHENDINDKGYQQFVAPIVASILKNHTSNEQGLDFGCGTGPVIADLLQQKQYSIRTYDPFFNNDQSTLQQTYDYIVCCEVIEHFHHPMKEFQLLKSLLKPNGKLYCKTDIYTDQMNFSSWYYKNDPTHVFFYHPETLEWIQENYGFNSLQIIDHFITFS